MPWDNSPAARARSNLRYGGDWRKARAQALARAGYRCEQCRSPMRLEVDHITPISRGGTHALSNLQVLCAQCHDRKTAGEGNAASKRQDQPADPQHRATTAW